MNHKLGISYEDSFCIYLFFPYFFSRWFVSSLVLLEICIAIINNMKRFLLLVVQILPALAFVPMTPSPLRPSPPIGPETPAAIRPRLPAGTFLATAGDDPPLDPPSSSALTVSNPTGKTENASDLLSSRVLMKSRNAKDLLSQVEDDGYTQNSRGWLRRGMTKLGKFRSSRRGRRWSRFVPAKLKKEPGTLILVRHGESLWNQNKTFTGWADPGEVTPIPNPEIDPSNTTLAALAQ